MFGVHGVGGATGTLLTGVFAVGGDLGQPRHAGGLAGLLEGNPRQVLIQLYGIVVTLVWSGVLTFVLLKVIDLHGAAAREPAAARSKASTSPSTAKRCSRRSPLRIGSRSGRRPRTVVGLRRPRSDLP